MFEEFHVIVTFPNIFGYFYRIFSFPEMIRIEFVAIKKTFFETKERKTNTLVGAYSLVPQRLFVGACSLGWTRPV